MKFQDCFIFFALKLSSYIKLYIRLVSRFPKRVNY